MSKQELMKIKFFPGRWPFVGVNLFVSSHQKWNPGANWTEAIDSWFSEVDDFAFPNQSPTGRQTGHYTQVIKRIYLILKTHNMLTRGDHSCRVIDLNLRYKKLKKSFFANSKREKFMKMFPI